MPSDFVKATSIVALGGTAFIISFLLFFMYAPDISKEIIGVVSLVFPSAAYIYIYNKYKEVFWKSFFVGTISMFVLIFIILIFILPLALKLN